MSDDMVSLVSEDRRKGGREGESCQSFVCSFYRKIYIYWGI